MRQYIKTLAMLLMVSLGFAACNNDTDEFDDYKVTYPTTVPLGYYHSNYSFDDNYEFGVLLTKNSKNDTVFQLIMEGKAGGNDSASVRTLMVTTDITYNDTIGMMYAYSESENFYENETKAYLAYKKDLNQLILSVEAGDKKIVSTTLTLTHEAPAVASIWEADGLILNLQAVGKDANKLPGSIMVGNADEEKLTYSYNGSNGEFTTASGVKGSFAYNENYQLVVKVGEKSYTCDRTFSTPEPENFVQIAVGNYSHSVGVIDGQPVFNEKYEAGLFQSDKDPNRYVISPWLANTNGLVVLVNPENGKITVEPQPTGYEDRNYGSIFGTDVFSYAGSQLPSNSHFDGKTFYLDMAYIVQAGAFCFVHDIFEITDTGEASIKKVTFDANSMKFVPTSKALISK